MLKIISANLNGIRSAAQKGFFDWLTTQEADCVCVQEIKCAHDDLPNELRNPVDFNSFFHHAEKKGYSGTGIYFKKQPDAILTGFGNDEFDAEGRYTEIRYGKLSIISVYVPSGSSSDERQQAKYRFMDAFMPHLQALKQQREVILCGDINIVHKEIDIKNWKSNQKNSGCLPEERAWLTQLFDEVGYIDVFRQLDQRPEQYTWWSNRGQAYAKNVGWRIDYQIATPAIAQTANQTLIYRDQKFSDHAPLIMTYQQSL